jgi:hypothetical protein
VIVGDNESAKSSWHAATFAGLCGRRRGKGRPAREDQRFADLHKPWDSDEWRVSTRVVLDDGRHIELDHDLAGKVACSARDELGRDVSTEIIHDGAPDGSRWLGLDRASFAATACVAQTQLMRVLEDASGLQEYLQRAAATAGAEDTTIATALDRLDTFAAERVGTERANSSRPLQLTRQARDTEARLLEQARAAHAGYLERLTEVEQLRERATHTDAICLAYDAAAALARREHLAGELERARELHAAHGDTAPTSPVDRDSLAGQVNAALAAWHAAPQLDPDTPATRARIATQLTGLPQPPTGDQRVHPSVAEAWNRLNDARGQLHAHDSVRPGNPADTVPDSPAADAELLDLARTLDQRPGPRLPAADLPVTPTPAPTGRDSAFSRRFAGAAVLILGALITLAGVFLVLASPPARAVASAVAAVGVCVLIAGGITTYRGAAGRTSRLQPAPGKPATVIDIVRSHAAETERRRDEAVARCHTLGLPADPALLRRIPAHRAQADLVHQWRRHHTGLARALTCAASGLARSLGERGEPTAIDDPAADPATPEAAAAAADGAEAAARRYHDQCQARAEQSVAAASRESLTARLADLDAATERVHRTREDASRLVLAAARNLPDHPDHPDRPDSATGGSATEQAVAALRTWNRDYRSQLEQFTTAQQGWAQLQAILGDGTLEDLAVAARRADTRAHELVARADPTLLARAQAAGAPSELTVSEYRTRAAEAKTVADTAVGELRAMADTLPNVAEAEEALSRAETAHARVRRLGQTLELTREYLRGAQDRVHRQIAPILAETLRAGLAPVTGGRYTDVRIDPASLQVTVRGPADPHRWRAADRLSHGTAEQIHLLLRIALATHLTTGHGSCPLLLDDVTVHADAARTRDVLELLLQASTHRQIVLFTQEDQVAAWADQYLTDIRDRVIRLGGGVPR